MRHMVDGRKFGINTSHRNARFKVMANQLIQNEKMVTTVQRAKELRRVVDRLITLGKAGSLHAKRLAFDRSRDRDTVVKLFSTLAERYANRAGGYTRILRVDETRRGDGAEMALIELVDRPIVEKKKKVAKKTKDEDKAHDHDHTHDKKHAGAAHTKISGGSTKAAGGKSAGVRKTPTKSGGGRSSSGSSS